MKLKQIRPPQLPPPQEMSIAYQSKIALLGMMSALEKQLSVCRDFFHENNYFKHNNSTFAYFLVQKVVFVSVPSVFNGFSIQKCLPFFPVISQLRTHLPLVDDEVVTTGRDSNSFAFQIFFKMNSI